MPQPYHNNGAICWLNSLIQCLLAVPQFRAEIAAINEFARANYPGKNLTGSSLGIAAAFEPNDPQMPMRVLHSLIAAMRAKGVKSANFTPFAQQCPDEGFHLLIDGIDDTDLTAVFQTRYDLNIKCVNCGVTTSVKNAPNIVIDLEFRGDSRDFASMIMQPELANDSYRCEKCGICRPTMLKYNLRMANECVVVRVRNNNVGGAFGLSREHVRYPAEFTLPGVASPRHYTLRAIAVHSGIQRATQNGNVLSFNSSGHYTANVYIDKWYTCNDTTIYETANFMTPAAYLLFYVLDN